MPNAEENIKHTQIVQAEVILSAVIAEALLMLGVTVNIFYVMVLLGAPFAAWAAYLLMQTQKILKTLRTDTNENIRSDVDAVEIGIRRIKRLSTSIIIFIVACVILWLAIPSAVTLVCVHTAMTLILIHSVFAYIHCARINVFASIVKEFKNLEI